VVEQGARVSGLERLRIAPGRVSGPELVRALDRVSELAGLGTGRAVAASATRGAVGRPAVIKKMGIAWHLRLRMAEKGMFQTSELVAPLAERGITLSREQV
jgi:hypothetical protein